VADGSDERIEFRERHEGLREEVPDRELISQREREELTRRFSAVERERDRLKEDIERLQVAFRKLGLAWRLSKTVISERFGAQTGNLIRQGIETQVERELGAGLPEDSE
jgi:hypothetical protein